jgi:hypothetical protein
VPAKAADDDKTIDQRVIGALLEGIGLQSPDRKPIEYHERAPLVIPPTATLPPPDNGEAIAANPAWPKDPDVIRRREAARQERNRNISEEREREQNPLRPDQLAPGPRPTRAARGDDGYQSSPSGFSEPMRPSQLGAASPMTLFGKMFGASEDSKPVQFTGEPPRADLTAPPAGYQTPSPDQPYGPGKAGPVKPTDDYVTRGELNSGR